MAPTREATEFTSIIPNLTADDLSKSVTFYEALGFTIDERWEEEGTLVGVMMRAGSTRLGLSQDDWKKGRDRRKGVGVRILVETAQNVDEIAARARSAGVTLGREPHDTEWSARAFEVTDPTGFILTVFSEKQG